MHWKINLIGVLRTDDEEEALVRVRAGSWGSNFSQ
jgi:hypothetical protein